MFTRGGVYRIVKEALGGTFAKLSVSALMFDYVLTGPISGVSAGHYIVGMMNDLCGFSACEISLGGGACICRPDHCFGVHRGLHHDLFLVAEHKGDRRVQRKGTEDDEDHDRDGRDSAGVGDLYGRSSRGASASAADSVESALQPGCLGFLKGTPLCGVAGPVRRADGVRALGAGDERRRVAGAGESRDRTSEAEESEARGDRHRDLQLHVHRRVHAAGGDDDSGRCAGACLSRQPDRGHGDEHGRAAGAADRLPRLCRDGWLSDPGWSGEYRDRRFDRRADAHRRGWRADGLVPQAAAEVRDQLPDRQPGRRHAVAVIVMTRGNVIMIGEAYAFGVIWSFTFNALAMLVLRWKYHGERGWKVPLNLRIGKTEIPLGLMSVFLVLFTTAIVNLFTKSVATISGVIFAAALFVIFSLSERDNKRRHDLSDAADAGTLSAGASGQRRA